MRILRRRKNRIAIVDVDGIITDSRIGASREKVVADLERAEQIKARAVVLRINSPGGTVGASQEIHQAVVRLRKRGFPVVASLGDVAASGGIYVAVAADRIVANPGTVTGSIGVILKSSNLRALYQKIGVESEVVKSGPYKDLLSTFRPLTAEERQLLQGLIDDTYNQFVTAVANGRNLAAEQVRNFADGRIFTGQQAKELGLLDELGGQQRAIDLAAEMVRMVGKPNVVQISTRKRGWLARLFGAVEKIEFELEFLRSLAGIPLWLMPM